MTTTTHLEYQVRSSRCSRTVGRLATIYLDLKGVDNMEFRFDLGEPFHPFQQLMGVLPEASKELIPMAYQVREVS